ncbi:MAG TPA: TonB-dependent receptor [Pyrinomonadaceae bacterium]|nr:TonB-dependent receptor [Pyrinomonadaceae bacterium]
MSRKTISHAARLLALAATLTLLSVSSFAQSQATTGDIEGRVLDPQGAVIPGVTVTATNQATGFEKSTTTDGDGNYRIIVLPPGSYNVKTSAPGGFQAGDYSNVTVTVGGKTPLEITLPLAGADTVTVNVDAEPPVVETTRTSVSTTINERAIQNLPVNGRNYLDFATLTPGVIRDPTRQGDLSVGGQKGTLNSLQVDGVDNNNTFFGQAFGRTGVRPPYQFSEESVQEFQVNQNGFSSEFGRSGGAVINVVTKSGSNEFHGGLFEFFRDESLNANPTANKNSQAQRGLLNKRTPQQINQFGGRIGGPIVKNRAFFFFTYDGQRQDLTNPIDAPNVNSAPLAVRNILLPKLETYPIGRDQDVFMAKGDIRLNNSNQLSLRFNRQNFTGINNESTGAQSVLEHTGSSLARTTTFSGTLASTLTEKLVNELRFQVARDAEPGEANTDQPEARIGTVVAGTTGTFLNIGRNNFSPRETTIRRWQFVDNLLYATGRHNLKTGIDFNFDRILNFFPGFFSGQYTFNNYTAFGTNTPSGFQQAFAGAGTTGATTHPDINDYAVYVQDDWKVTPKLTLNMGVRYDLETLAAPPVRNPDPQLINNGLDTSTQPSDTNNIAPRFGFSYAFDDKSTLRGGYGIFYGRTTGIMLGTAHSQNGINVKNFSLTAAQITALGLTYPNVLAAAPSVGASPISIYLFADDYAQPYVQQGRLGYEREIMRGTSLSVNYMFFKGVHVSRTRDINLPAPTLVTFTDPTNGATFQVPRFVAPRPLTNYSRVNLFESTGNSEYNAIAFQLQRRFVKGWQFLATYTFSKAKDDRPDQTSVVPGNAGDDAKIVFNQLNVRDDYGTADVDIPHRFVFSSVREFGTFKKSNNAFLRALLSNYTFSSITQINSGVPYTATVGADLNNDGNRFNDRAPGTVRNQFRTRAFWQSDMRITRTIFLGENMRLRLIGEGFNLTNRTNVLAPNLSLYSGFTGANVFTIPTGTLTFGLPRTFFPSREFQLAVKFEF